MDLGHVSGGAGGGTYSVGHDGNSRFRAPTGLGWIRIAVGHWANDQRGHFCAGAIFIRMARAWTACEKPSMAEASCGSANNDGIVLCSMDCEELCGVSQGDSLPVELWIGI